MATRKLDRLGLPCEEAVLQKLRLMGLATAGDLLQESAMSLMVKCDVDLSVAAAILARTAATVAEKRYVGTVLEMSRKLGIGGGGLTARELRFISTGIPGLNDRLHGGLVPGTINEFCGPPGVGKSQLCFQTAIEYLLAWPQGGVVFFDTELKFNPDRAFEMMRHRNEESEDGVGIDYEHVLSRILVKRPHSTQQLLQEVEAIQTLVISRNVQLIVIDSIAAIPRKEGMNEPEKDAFVSQLGAKLKMIASICRCVVICTNQILTEHQSHASVFNDTIRSNADVYKPALGSIWFHCLTNRIVLSSRVTGGGAGFVNGAAPDSGMADSFIHHGRIRRLELIKSPYLSSFAMYFRIETSGLVEVADYD